MIEINWKPNKATNVTLYKQIVDYIKDKIYFGEWTVGTRLPSQRELAKLFNVNRSTIVEALDELKAEGLIEGNGRAGTRIVNNTWSLLASYPSPNWQDYLSGGIFKPNKPTIQMINKLEFDDSYIRLGTGELSPSLYPKDIMKGVLGRVANNMDSLGYEAPMGSLKLRRAISKYLLKYGIKASPESILIVSGSLQALQLISMGIMQPNTRVILESPSYLKSLHIFESMGMRLKGLEMDQDGLIVGNIIKNKAKSNATVLYTIPTYHNPTARVMKEDRRLELIKTCESHRIPIIEDDVYRELYLDDPPPMPLKAMDKSGNVLYLGSVSKSFAPGLRIGWLVGPQTVVERLGDIKMQLDYGASSISQAIVTDLFTSGEYDRYNEILRNELLIRREKTLEYMNKYFYDIGTWEIPAGGFYIWLKLDKGINTNRLFELAIKNKILINPGNIYDFYNNSCVRISFAYAKLEDIKYGLSILAKLIKDLQNMK